MSNIKFVREFTQEHYPESGGFAALSLTQEDYARCDAKSFQHSIENGIINSIKLGFETICLPTIDNSNLLLEDSISILFFIVLENYLLGLDIENVYIECGEEDPDAVSEKFNEAISEMKDDPKYAFYFEMG